MSAKEILDLGISKFVSRKLLVFIVASVGLFLGVLQGSDWTIIAGVYIGTQGVVDLMQQLYLAKNGISNQNNFNNGL